MKSPQNTNSKNVLPTVSRRHPDGRLIELVYDKENKHTRLAIGCGTAITLEKEIELPDGTHLVPYSPTNNLIKHGVLMLANHPEPYGSVADLIAEIDAYLYRYVDLSDSFRTLASYYILLTWVYDAFNELPYLRFQGDYGSGKTRALMVVGSLCHKAFFASGASTVSPIFHTLDEFRGTLVIDEADFRFSDEKAEMSKILNNGNVRGFPVLRTQVTQKKEFEPRAFNVFGPKVVAMRKSFEDQALESRFFTEEMGTTPPRGDIPINLPDAQSDEALAIRNQLLSYRFDRLLDIRVDASLVDPKLSPRLNQILVPLLSIVDDATLRANIRRMAGQIDRDLLANREQTPEAVLRSILVDLGAAGRETASVGEIAGRLRQEMGDASGRPLTNRYVGELLRQRLGVAAYKSHGVYVVLLAKPEHSNATSSSSEEAMPPSGISPGS